MVEVEGGRWNGISWKTMVEYLTESSVEGGYMVE